MQYASRLKGQFVQVYSEAFRRNVIEEYLSTDVSKMFLLRKYGIKMKSGLQPRFASREPSMLSQACAYLLFN